jgi:hypothetical protein
VSIEYHIKTPTSRANKFFGYKEVSDKKLSLFLYQNQEKILKPKNIQTEDT